MAHHPTDWWCYLHHCHLYGLLMGWGSSSVPVAVTCYRSYWHFFKERRYLSCGLGRLCSRWLLRPFRLQLFTGLPCLVTVSFMYSGSIQQPVELKLEPCTFSRDLGSCACLLCQPFRSCCSLRLIVGILEQCHI